MHRPSPQTVFTQKLIHPDRVAGSQRWIQLDPVVQKMIATALVALVNERLQVQHHIRVGRTQ